MRRRPPHLLHPRILRTTAVALALSCLWIPGAGATPAAPKPPSADQKLRELQAKRDQLRSEKAKTATNVNALQASDSEIQSALADLKNNIEGQTSLLEESQRAVASAEAEQTSAEQAEAKAVEELAALKTSIKDQAIRAYISSPQDETLQLLSADSLADASREKTLLAVQASKNLDAAERYRAVQEDLGIARERSKAAAEKATTRREEAAGRLERLEAAEAEQERFSDEVEARIESALAEADNLAQFDTVLSDQITGQQKVIADQLAAQRAAAKRRGRGTPVPTGGAAVTLPNTNGAGIVNVGGIRVHSQIAGNLQNLLNAASAAGISLSGGGYRDPAGQIAVRRSNCGSSNYAIYQMPASSCSPPTARPGQSMHERGLAVDFTSGGSTLTRSSAAFAWMKANANSYGFYNLPSEPWHWSSTGT